MDIGTDMDMDIDYSWTEALGIITLKFVITCVDFVSTLSRKQSRFPRV
jgi:hypothetical protein